MLRNFPTSAFSHAILAILLATFHTPSRTLAAGFVGETKCANPTCHGAALPAAGEAPPDWRPWKSARTQWLNRNIDRHSRAYATLETADSKRIAGYMGITATQSEKCLVCHAPPAAKAEGSNHRQADGVSCEHCHGPAEHWLKPHVEKDWPQKRAQYVERGFYDDNDFVLRARKCASCHVRIDHEIVAGGHPPLQFEMVAYAQVMKHWDDSDERPKDAFSADPTLWSVGQVVGLHDAVEMVAERAGGESYQGLGKFSHFEERSCYQCHHKLVEDALRQASGHYAMVDIVVGTLFPGQRSELSGLWRALSSGVPSSAAAAQSRARELASWLAPVERRVASAAIDRPATRTLLQRLVKNGQTVRGMERFTYARPERSNVLRLSGIELPWWYTTGAVEQTVLGVLALCDPAYGDRCAKIDGDIRALVRAADRNDFKRSQFDAALKSIQGKLF